MKASELRIGNWILPKMKEYKSEWKDVSLGPDIPIQPEPIQVFPHLITRMVFNEDTLKMYESIPLTEEWLSKFELEHVEVRGRWIKDKFVIWKQRYLDPLSIFEENKFYLQMVDFHGDIFTLHLEIKYVHQLQNLYFALTGEELTFKSE